MKCFSPPILPLAYAQKLLAQAASLGPVPASWLEPAWFIDPVSGSDTNAGTTQAAPLKTWAALVARWGTTAPTLKQDVTITWLSSAPADASDPVIFTPVIVGATVVLQGALVQVHAGNLAGVVAKNRATPQLLNADLGFAATPGMLVENTQAGKSSRAMVFENVAGTVFALSQPLTPAVVPVGISNPPAEFNTWANGDTFKVYRLVGVHIVELAPLVAEFVTTPFFYDQLQVLHLRYQSPNGPGNSDTNHGEWVSCAECSFDVAVEDHTTAFTDPLSLNQNCYFGFDYQGGFNTALFGGVLATPFGSLCALTPDFDAIIDCGVGSSLIPIHAIFAGTFYVRGDLSVDGQSLILIPADSFSGDAVVWGPGTLNMAASSRCAYTAPAASRFLTVALRVNDQVNANSFNYATGAWSAAIALTAAHLDDPASLNGIAVNVGGASFTSQATP